MKISPVGTGLIRAGVRTNRHDEN